MGSVGKLNPRPPSSSWKLIANGVKKTTRRVSLSIEKSARRIIKIPAGIKLK